MKTLARFQVKQLTAAARLGSDWGSPAAAFPRKTADSERQPGTIQVRWRGRDAEHRAPGCGLTVRWRRRGGRAGSWRSGWSAVAFPPFAAVNRSPAGGCSPPTLRGSEFLLPQHRAGCRGIIITRPERLLPAEPRLSALVLGSPHPGGWSKERPSARRAWARVHSRVRCALLPLSRPPSSSNTAHVPG